ncbi:MAG: DNA topoisomerase III, partial [Firmicutes bacterium]|nr:DNA topoisomerase III [Bacillota bacterium]
AAIVDTMDFTEVSEPDIKRVSDNSKVSDHHAIIPTINIKSKDLSSLSKNEKDLLYLVSTGLLMAVSPKYVYESTSIVLKCMNCDFKATGKQVINKGFKNIFRQFAAHTRSQKENDEEDMLLPLVKSGNGFSVTAKVAEHLTQSPKPYTEDILLSAMEKAGSSDYIETDIERKGLGTPATRAGIIETLLKREYITRNNKQLISTEKGKKVIDTVPEALKSAKMTADWENELSLIAKGKSDSTVFMAEIAELVKSIIK